MPVIWLHYTNKESGGRIPVMVEWDWNVRMLKEAITVQLSRIPQKLIFCGKEMHNESVLREINLSEFSTVYCVIATHIIPHFNNRRSHPPSLPPRRYIPKLPVPPTGLDIASIEVHLEEDSYVPMRSPWETVRMEVFNFSDRCYMADTDSIASEHIYEHLGEFSLHSSQGSSLDKKSKRRHFSVFCRLCNDITRGKLLVRCFYCKYSPLSLTRDPSCWSDITSELITGCCSSCKCEGVRAEFYFECIDHPHEDNNATPLKQIKMNERAVECIICAESPERLMVFECVSLHVTCLPCFREYVKVNLVARQFRYDTRVGYSLGCPAGCPDSLVTDAQHFRVVGEELYERLQRFAAEEFVLAEGGVLCPAVGCGEGVLPGSKERLVTCETCCHMFCRRCMNRAHFGACESSRSVRGGVTRIDMKGNAVRSSWRFGGEGRDEGKDEQDWIEAANIKSCPGCNVAVEREGGCSHITCGVGVCQQEWCWLCEKEWKRECEEDHWFE